MENIVRKGEIACNKQFVLFSQYFLPNMALIFILKCRLQFVSIWTSPKFCCLVMALGLIRIWLYFFSWFQGVPFPGQEQCAIDAVMQYAIHELGFMPDDIVLYAWSIGGYTASWAAMNYPDAKYLVSRLLFFAKAAVYTIWTDIYFFRTYYLYLVNMLLFLQ